jgi:hypothetical protein
MNEISIPAIIPPAAAGNLTNLISERAWFEPERIVASRPFGDSWQPVTAKEFEDESIDFVFIDANHTYEFVSKDIAAFLPKMKKGGIMAGHDFNGAHPGVVQAVIEAFIGDINLGREGFYNKPNSADGKPSTGLTYDKFQDVWCVRL